MPDTTTHLMWFTINYPHGLLPFMYRTPYYHCGEEDTYPSTVNST